MVLIKNNDVQKINRTMAIPLNQLQSLSDRNPRGVNVAVKRVHSQVYLCFAER